ncbi:MAG: hypothetical protein K6T27_08960 [Thermoleophilum sp.]|nr:hypothetical protein [Thermoleophilum sp.]
MEARGAQAGEVPALAAAIERALAGGPEHHRRKAAEQGKLPVRERIARLVDPGSFCEDGLLAHAEEEGFGADGVVTGTATVDGRPICLMANDPTVKAGSWGPRTVEKIVRIQERALRLEVPIVYLVDSAAPPPLTDALAVLLSVGAGSWPSATLPLPPAAAAAPLARPRRPQPRTAVRRESWAVCPRYRGPVSVPLSPRRRGWGCPLPRCRFRRLRRRRGSARNGPRSPARSPRRRSRWRTRERR